MEKTMITALAGGVGASKLLVGLQSLLEEENLKVIVNTGDDIELYGLHVSPDLDIVMYTLAGIVDADKGWGIDKDTFNCLSMLERYDQEIWFNLGDRDLATHILRTAKLRDGKTLTEVTQELCSLLGVGIEIIPMTDEKVASKIRVAPGKKGIVHFEEYLVERGAKDEVLEVIYSGVSSAKPAPRVLEYIERSEIVVVCPSNPIVSIGTILAIKGIREALRETDATVIGVSPIIEGRPVKGPADSLMRGLGLEVSAVSVAELYRDFLDIFVLDSNDEAKKDRIEEMGMATIVTNTIMKNRADKKRLAEIVLRAAGW